MTDSSELQPRSDESETTLYRPTADGGLEAAGGQAGDYRDQLRSERWNAAPLSNPEVQKTDGRIVVLAIAILSAITLVVLVLGYGSGFWG